MLKLWRAREWRRTLNPMGVVFFSLGIVSLYVTASVDRAVGIALLFAICAFGNFCFYSLSARATRYGRGSDSWTLTTQFFTGTPVFRDSDGVHYAPWMASILQVRWMKAADVDAAIDLALGWSPPRNTVEPSTRMPPSV